MARRWSAVPAFEWAALTGLVALFVWKSFVPAWLNLNTDFPNYYLAAKLLQQGFPFERVYDWIWFQRQKDHAAIAATNVVGYTPLSPFSALLVMPLTGLSALAAKQVWLVLNLGLLAGTIVLLGDLTRLGRRRIALITFLTVVPLRSSFLFGQQHLLILFLLTLAVWLLVVSRRPAAAGAVIAVAAAIKIYPAIFALYFARKRRWAALAGLLVTMLATLVLGLALFGRETWRVYGLEILPRSLAGESNHPYWIGYNAPLALLRRLLVVEPQLNPAPLANAPGLFSWLAALVQAVILFATLWCVTSRRSEPERERLELGAFTAMLLVLSTSPVTYHLCPIVLSTVLAVDHLLAAGRRRAALGVVALHAIIAAPLSRFLPDDPAGWTNLLAVPRMWAMLVFWVAYLRILARAGRRAPSLRLVKPTRAQALGIVAFATLVVVAATSSHRHLRTLSESYRWRLPVGRSSLIAAEPAAGGREVYFSRMDDSSLFYTLDRTAGGVAIGARPGEDAFHPTFAPQGGEGWVELASGVSRIARFPSGETEVEAGEHPGVSADGRWLGFIREQRGRGALWIKDRRHGTTEQVVGVTDDVRSFAFLPDGRIVAASSAPGRSRLLIVDRATGAQEEVDTAQRRGKDPAVSPDGRWLAYSREESGSWQLWVMDLASRRATQVTDAHCNSVQPAWGADSRTILYASDCGRGVGQTAACARDDVVR